jgi:hypothetical protein
MFAQYSKKLKEDLEALNNINDNLQEEVELCEGLQEAENTSYELQQMYKRQITEL